MRKKGNLLKKIRDVVQKTMNIEMDIIDFMNFILGDIFLKDEIVKIDIETLDSSDSQLQNIYCGNRNLDNKSLSFLAVSKSCNWSYDFLETFFYEKAGIISQSTNNDFGKEISKLCKQPEISSSEDIGKMLNALAWYYFFGKKEIEVPLFVPYDVRNCKPYVELPQKKTELNEMLNKENVVYITGLPGTGKKEFIKNYISNEHYNAYDVAWIAAEKREISKAFTDETIFLVPDEDGICDESKEKILNTGLLTVRKKLELLKQKKHQGLMVIDSPCLSDSDINFINDYIAPTQIKCLIITRRKLFPNSVSEISLDGCPDDILMQIFSKKSGEVMPFSVTEFSQLCKNLSHNPLAVSLMAQTVKALSKPIEKKEDIKKLKNSFMDIETAIWEETNLPKIHNAYKAYQVKTGVSMKTILQRMFRDFPEEFYQNEDLPKLAFWARMEIPLDVLRNACNESVIQSARLYGILKHCDPSRDDKSKKLVFMPALFADIILDEFPVLFENYQTALQKILLKDTLYLDLATEYPAWRKITYKVIAYFSPHTTFLKTKLTESNIKVYREWNFFVLECINICLQCGDAHAAKKLSQELYTSREYNSYNRTERFTVQHIQAIIKQTALLITEMDVINDADFMQKINTIIGECEKFANKKHHAKEYNAKEIATLCELGNSLESIVKKCVSQKYNPEDIALSTADQYILRIHGCIISQLKRNKSVYMDESISECLKELKSVVNLGLDEDYYQMIKGYTRTLCYKGDFTLSQEARDYFIKLIGNVEISHEMKLHASLYRFYYMIEQEYGNAISKSRLISKGTCENLIFEYGQLYRHYRSRNSIVNLLIFYRVTLDYVFFIWNNLKVDEVSFLALFQVTSILKEGHNLLQALEGKITDMESEAFYDAMQILHDLKYAITQKKEYLECDFEIEEKPFPAIWIE